MTVVNDVATWLTGLTDDETLFFLGAVMTVTSLLVIAVTAMLILDEPERKRKGAKVAELANHFPECDAR